MRYIGMPSLPPPGSESTAKAEPDNATHAGSKLTDLQLVTGMDEAVQGF